MKISLLIALSLILMVFVLVGCANRSDEWIRATQPTYPTNLSAKDRFGPPIYITAEVSKPYYTVGDEIEVTLLFENPMNYSVFMDPFPPFIEIWPDHLKKGEFEDDELVRSFVPGGQSIELDAGETCTYNLSWDQKDNKEEQVTPGQHYTIKVAYFETWPASNPDYVSSRGGQKPTRVLIQPLQGAMEGITEVNQSQTVKNLPFTRKVDIDYEIEMDTELTIALERIEMLAEGTRLHVRATSPYFYEHYDCHNQPRQPWKPNAPAHITIDSVTRYANLLPEEKYWPITEDSINLIWGDSLLLDPVPSDAKELTFIITRWGDWEGPWEFHVPLE